MDLLEKMGWRLRWRAMQASLHEEKDPTKVYWRFGVEDSSSGTAEGNLLLPYLQASRSCWAMWMGRWWEKGLWRWSLPWLVMRPSLTPSAICWETTLEVCSFLALLKAAGGRDIFDCELTSCEKGWRKDFGSYTTLLELSCRPTCLQSQSPWRARGQLFRTESTWWTLEFRRLLSGRGPLRRWRLQRLVWQFWAEWRLPRMPMRPHGLLAWLRLLLTWLMKLKKFLAVIHSVLKVPYIPKSE